MLTPEERTLLQDFVERNDEDAPYWRRVNIVLLNDAGNSPEAISAALGVPAVQTRQWINVFKREGIRVFPDSVLRTPALFSADDPITEAGRAFLREQLGIIERHAEALRSDGESTAVHETRKAIRRMRITFALLAPYFEENLFEPYRRSFRKTLRSLAPARDAFVFLLKLERYLGEAYLPLEIRAEMDDLQRYRSKQLEKAAGGAAKAARKRSYRWALDAFGRLVNEAYAGVVDVGDQMAPTKLRHLAPPMITGRMAEVLAFGDIIGTASLSQLHSLRIRFKYFRYTLDFLTPILGNDVLTLTGQLNGIQDHLGDLQDARIAQELLAQARLELGDSAAIDLYEQVKGDEVEHLVRTFPAVWDQFDNVQWRRTLAASMMQL